MRSYGTTYTAASGYHRPKPIGAAADWCWHVTEVLSDRVGTVVDSDFKTLMGSQGKTWLTRGLKEAAERVANQASFDWMGIMPLIWRTSNSNWEGTTVWDPSEIVEKARHTKPTPPPPPPPPPDTHSGLGPCSGHARMRDARGGGGGVLTCRLRPLPPACARAR